MRKVRLLLFLFFCLLPTLVFALEITFIPEVEVSNNFVTLGDIATFSDTSDTATALASRRICNAPLLGKKLALNTKTTQTKLQRSLKLEPDFIWKGAATTLITRKGLRISPADMEASINDYLIEESDSLPPAEYSFITRQLPMPFDIPDGYLEVRVIPSNPQVIGSKRFSLVYVVDEKIIKNISIRGQLKALAPVAVLNQSVRRDTILHPDMVDMKIKDLSDLRNPCTNLRMVLGKKLSRRQRAGTVLDLSSIEFPPVIHKGQLVKMIVNHNGLQLTATGIASMSGKQDEIIRVKNTRSNKNVFCKVSSPGIVEVQI